MIDLFFREAGLKPRQWKAVIFDLALELSAVRDEMDFEDLTCPGI